MTNICHYQNINSIHNVQKIMMIIKLEKMCSTLSSLLFAIIIYVHFNQNIIHITMAHNNDDDPKPPKYSPRIVAGYYSFHPVYDTDVPAVVKTLEPATSIHYHFYTKQNETILSATNQLFQSKFVKYRKKKRRKYRLKYKKTKTHQPSIEQYHVDQLYLPQIYLHKIYVDYLKIARSMAKVYGKKYNYPIDILYVSITWIQ